jgi:hypothetical protein
MAVLANALLRRLGVLIACALMAQSASPAEAPSEYQVKAVFLFNFSRFVDWPPRSLNSPTEPFVIGVLGADPFSSLLDEAVRNEHVSGHPLIVKRFNRLDELGDCQILFIDRSESSRLDGILKTLDHRSILTVSEIDGAAQHGVMVEFVTSNNRIGLKIDVDAARAAGLSISSKLLRLADIVNPTPGSSTP